MLENILQLTAVVVVFVLVLAGTYYVTKWIAKSGMIQSQSRNIKVIETFKITNGKYIQIIQLGKKYYSIGVTKDQITFLTPLDEAQLDFSEEVRNGQNAGEQLGKAHQQAVTELLHIGVDAADGVAGLVGIHIAQG